MNVFAYVILTFDTYWLSIFFIVHKYEFWTYNNNTNITFEVYKRISIFIYLIRLTGGDKVVRIQLLAAWVWVEPSINIPRNSGGGTAWKRVRWGTRGIDESVTCDGGAVFWFCLTQFLQLGEPLTFYFTFFVFKITIIIFSYV